jgi:hypothetical protein
MNANTQYQIIDVFMQFIGWYLGCRLFINNIKTRAWIISLSSSFILSIYGIMAFNIFMYSGFNVDQLLSSDIYSSINQQYAHNIFAGSMILDLIIGMIDYRSQIQLMTGWIHHIIYLIICYFFASSKYSALFVLCYIVEIPTFILGVCKFFPTVNWLKTLFTFVFFICRICFLTFIAIKYIFHETNITVIICLVFSFFLNSFWFYKMINPRKIIRDPGSNSAKVSLA